MDPIPVSTYDVDEESGHEMDKEDSNQRGRWLDIFGDFYLTLYSNPMRKLFGYLIPITVPSISDEADSDSTDYTVFPMPNDRKVEENEVTRCFMVFCLSVVWMSVITYLLLSAVSTMGDHLDVSASTMGIHYRIH